MVIAPQRMLQAVETDKRDEAASSSVSRIASSGSMELRCVLGNRCGGSMASAKLPAALRLDAAR